MTSLSPPKKKERLQRIHLAMLSLHLATFFMVGFRSSQENHLVLVTEPGLPIFKISSSILWTVCYCCSSLKQRFLVIHCFYQVPVEHCWEIICFILFMSICFIQTFSDINIRSQNILIAHCLVCSHSCFRLMSILRSMVKFWHFESFCCMRIL